MQKNITSCLVWVFGDPCSVFALIVALICSFCLGEAFTLGELHRFKEPVFHAKINVCMGMKHWDNVMKSDWAFQSFLETVHFVSLRGSHLCWMALKLNQSSWCDIMWWKSVERFVENMLHSGNEIKSHNNGTESPADGNLCPMDLCTTTDFIQYHPSPHGGWRR